VNHEIHNFFHEARIQLQHIVPYTPQKNGVVERKNQSLNKEGFHSTTSYLRSK
jgi:hypothetical protein